MVSRRAFQFVRPWRRENQGSRRSHWHWATGGYLPHLLNRWSAWIHSGDHWTAPRAIGATGEIVARVQDGDDERQSDRGVQWIAIPVALTDTSGAMSRKVDGLVGRDERTALSRRGRNIISRDVCQSTPGRKAICMGQSIRPFVLRTFSDSMDSMAFFERQSFGRSLSIYLYFLSIPFQEGVGN
jgi:hypothetical protein